MAQRPDLFSEGGTDRGWREDPADGTDQASRRWHPTVGIMRIPRVYGRAVANEVGEGATAIERSADEPLTTDRKWPTARVLKLDTTITQI